MSLLCVSEQARLWQDCVFIEAPLCLLSTYVIQDISEKYVTKK